MLMKTRPLRGRCTSNCEWRTQGLIDRATRLDSELNELGRKFDSRGTELNQLRATLACTNVELDQLKTTLANRKAEQNESQSRLAFLRLQFDTEQAKGIPKTDVVIYVQAEQDQPLHAHRIVLANRSSVVSKMFESEMLEGETGVVRIDDATFPVIRAVIRFCYHAEIDFTQEVSAEDVLAVAHKYAIPFLQEICEEHLSAKLDKDNLLKMLTLANKFGAKRLQNEAFKYVKNHFDEVIIDVKDLYY